MKPSELVQAVTIMVQTGQPCLVSGAPGIGKSMMVAQVAASLAMDLKDVRAVLLDPVDLRGLPHVNGDGRAHWATPDFLPRDGKGILFLDELNRAPQLVQNACLQLTLDRKLGEYTLPDGWVVVAAGNRESDGGGVTRMNSALSSRFVWLDAEVDVDDWCKWAIAANIEPATIAFARFRPELLHQFEPKARAFPCPRSWEFVSKITAQHAPPPIEHALFCGAVGEGAAVEYSAFLRMYRELPSIDGIFLNPDTATVPENPATLYAVTSAVARRINDSTISRALKYLGRLPEEFGVMAIRDAIQRIPALQSTPEFTTWAVAHSSVIF